MIRNLTPHVIVVVLPDGSTITLPPDPAGPARIGTVVEPIGSVAHDSGVMIPVVRSRLSEPINLPAGEVGVFLVVSAIVRTARPDRLDLLSPGELVRGPDGQPIGCKGLAR